MQVTKGLDCVRNAFFDFRTFLACHAIRREQQVLALVPECLRDIQNFAIGYCFRLLLDVPGLV